MPEELPTVSTAQSESPDASVNTSAGFALLIIVAGLALTSWAVLGNPDRFPHGPWPVILVGAGFSLCGFQLSRMALRQILGEHASLGVALAVYLGFGLLFSWAAFSTQVVFLNGNHQPGRDMLSGHLACAALGALCLIGASISLSRILPRVRH